MYDNKEVSLFYSNGDSKQYDISDHKLGTRYFCPVSVGENVWITTASKSDPNIMIDNKGNLIKEDLSIQTVFLLNEHSFIEQNRDGNVFIVEGSGRKRLTFDIPSDEVESFLLNNENAGKPVIEDICIEKEGFGLRTFLKNI